MNHKAYFLSDLHLKSMDEPNAQKLLKFLREADADAEVTHLFLVGDIFDLWIADHAYFVEKFAPVIEVLKALVKRGVFVQYFEGNHDLYLERFWAREVGMTVHVDSAVFMLDHLRVHVEHGDLIDDEDRGYRFLRWFLRTPVVTWAALHLHQSVVRQIGERASRASRVYTSETKTISQERAIAKIRAHAAFLLAQQPLDLVISGHLHVRDDFIVHGDSRSVRSVNLGSWFDTPAVFMVTPQVQKFVEC